MSMSEYNQYPKDIIEINPCNLDELFDLFVYCWESTESRQAYKQNNLYDNCEHLRIIWIKKDINLGYAIGKKLDTIKYYKIGSDEDWRKYSMILCSQFVGDNS